MKSGQMMIDPGNVFDIPEGCVSFDVGGVSDSGEPRMVRIFLPAEDAELLAVRHLAGRTPEEHLANLYAAAITEKIRLMDQASLES